MFKVRTEDKEPIEGIENEWPKRTSRVCGQRSQGSKTLEKGRLVEHSSEVQPAEDNPFGDICW